MGSEDLRLRENWQSASGNLAQEKERIFLGLFSDLFTGSEYDVEPQPREFKNIYFNLPLLGRDISHVYVPPPGEYRRHGFTPDFSIANTHTGKRIYVELKRQDGWVEGKPRSAGRGNAHERMGKYFTPGLRNALTESSGIVGDDILPFWIVFCGDITRDPCRVREITFWFQKYTDNFFFWRDNDIESIGRHFIDRIVPHLE